MQSFEASKPANSPVPSKIVWNSAAGILRYDDTQAIVYALKNFFRAVLLRSGFKPRVFPFFKNRCRDESALGSTGYQPVPPGYQPGATGDRRDAQPALLAQ